MKSTRDALLIAAATFSFLLAGCGGSSSNPNPPTPPAAVSVALSAQPPASLTVNAQTVLTANVSNDSANAGVRWTVTCGSSACGAFSAASTASGASTTYTAPAAVPTSNTVTVTATSVTDTTKTASATITITVPTVLKDGTYIYHLAGQDGLGPCFIVGAFTVANGVISGGKQDFSDSQTGYSNDAIVPAGSSLSMAGGNLQVVLATANTKVGAVVGGNGVITLRGTKVSSSRVVVSEYDTFAATTGSVDLQTSTAAPSGGYAFLVSGVALDTNGVVTGPLTIGGVLNVSGTAVSTSGSVFDYNNGKTPVLAQSFSSGTVSAPDQYGRVSFSLTPSTTSNLAGFILTGYIVGTNQIQLVESQSDALNDNIGGMALGQGSNTGAFNQASVSGKTYVYGSTGVDVVNLVQIAGKFVFNADGTLGGPLALNDLTNAGINTIQGGTYTVDATGRVNLSNLTTAPLNGPFGFQVYLDGNGNALVRGSDAVEVTAGPGYAQSSPADPAGSLGLTAQGFLENTSNDTAWSAGGPVTVTSGNITGYTDYNNEGTPAPNVSLTGSLNSSAGTMSLAGLNALAATTANSFAYFPIDSKRTIAVAIDGSVLALVTLEGVSP